MMRLFLTGCALAALLTGGATPASTGGTIYLPIVAGTSSIGPSGVGGCPMLPADNIWNTRVDHLPVDAYSTDIIASMGSSTTLHADFGSGLWQGAPIGIPFVVVPTGQPGVPVTFTYADESDPGPYPVPANAPIEGGPISSGDRHVLVVEQGVCRLYELYAAYPQNGGSSWTAGSGAIFDLNSNQLRPELWTSADAAGLPILPGLARYDEFSSGEISHALRITASLTRKEYTWPARHYASSRTSQVYPPMGQRFRLKASYNLRGRTPQELIFLRAFQRYGFILADNGANWFISGAPDERWDNTFLHRLFGSLQGADFEAVDSSSLQMDPNSGQARQP